MTITEQLAEALGKIKLCASPMDRTFDKMIQDMDWILAEARYALAAYEASKAADPVQVQGQRQGEPKYTASPEAEQEVRVLRPEPGYEDEAKELVRVI
jgi:hypothetical protein